VSYVGGDSLDLPTKSSKRVFAPGYWVAESLEGAFVMHWTAAM
jgi:hypothetical protein